MQRINPYLWFNDQAEEAANFYVEVFNNRPGTHPAAKVLGVDILRDLTLREYVVGEAETGSGPHARANANPVAAEACESDGTLRGYAAAIGLVHNISRDHGEVDTLRPQFEAFARQWFGTVVGPEYRVHNAKTVAGPDGGLGSVLVCDVHPAGLSDAHVPDLAAVGAHDRLHALRPLPARLERHAGSGRARNADHVDACLVGRPRLIR